VAAEAGEQVAEGAKLIVLKTEETSGAPAPAAP
jgi:hypothetical protein